jgi:hypothetical protein
MIDVAHQTGKLPYLRESLSDAVREWRNLVHLKTLRDTISLRLISGQRCKSLWQRWRSRSELSKGAPYARLVRVDPGSP